MKNQILEYVYNSFSINEAFNRFIEPKDRQEFKHYVMDILTKKDEKYLLKYYSQGKIDYLVYSIMRNQYLYKSSPWNIKVPIKEFMLEDTIGTNRLDFEYQEDDLTIKIEIEKMSEEISRILDDRMYQEKIDYKFFLKKQYHEYLFKMHFYEGLSYNKIQELTGIKYATIRNSILETLDYIKKNIKYDNYFN